MLPPIAFGGKTSPYLRSPIQMGNIQNNLLTGIKDYDSLDKTAGCLSQSSMVNINGLIGAAKVSTPTQFTTHCTDAHLIIPFYGEAKINSASSKFSCRAGNNAVLLSNDMFHITTSTRSILTLKLDEDRLVKTAQGMLGFDSNTAMLRNLSNNREVSMQLGNISFDAIFKQFANLLDQFYTHPELLNRTGIDDGIYSAVCMMLFPILFSAAYNLPAEPVYERRLLDQTCQYIKANLTNPITLTLLDKVSGMSRRKLHYAFQERYSCSPMQWVRDERLILAHSLLINAQPLQKVTAIALDCGFTKMSTFAQFYKNRFGVLPSETLSISKYK